MTTKTVALLASAAVTICAFMIDPPASFTLKIEPFEEAVHTIRLAEAHAPEHVQPLSTVPEDGSRPDEPLRHAFSLEAAVAFLDNAASTWQRDRRCFACHSDYAFLTTRPLVSWKVPVHEQLRSKLEELGANPRNVRFRVMEGVMAASVLAQNDALTTGKLSPVTRVALDYMWTLQRKDGGFDWEKSDQPPSEVDDHFGVTVAVMGVGMAPENYAETPAAQAGLGGIRRYLNNTPPVNLHQRSMLLLGSLSVDNIMTEQEQSLVVADLFASQKPDGGWGIVSLGNWKRHDGKSDDTGSSDGYGTGFALYVLRQSGVPPDDPRIQAGIAWLKANQRASGQWFTRSQWEDSKHYLSREGTAYAIRALVMCEQQ
jgi:squalene-hopene/tetraprenyl-beta-curcumene cyclase